MRPSVGLLLVSCQVLTLQLCQPLSQTEKPTSTKQPANIGMTLETRFVSFNDVPSCSKHLVTTQEHLLVPQTEEDPQPLPYAPQSSCAERGVFVNIVHRHIEGKKAANRVSYQS